MTRPLRLEQAGALYHVTTRGDRRQTIFRDDIERLAWIEVLEAACERHHLVVHSYCQMGNHYHLMLETVEPNLSHAMRQLNGLYTQHFNRRHRLVGHLFQGRYKAILVQKESYLLELTRYIVLNPVRARMVTTPDEWPWSSHSHFVAQQAPPSWLERDWLLAQFGKMREQAVAAYEQFVLDGIDKTSPLLATRHQILLGDDAFVSAHQQGQNPGTLVEVVREERRAVALPLSEYASRYSNRNEAMARAYLSTAFTMPKIAHAFGVSTRTVSRALSEFEKGF
jgi:putative transposase